MRHPLHWVARSATPYNAHLFRALAAEPSIDLTVHFLQAIPPDRPWKGRLTDGYLSQECRRGAGICWDLVGLAATDRQSLLVTGNWSEPTMLLSLTLLAARRRPFVVWTDTPDMARRRNPVKAYLRSAWLRRIFARATRVMGTGAPALAGLARMGCGQEKLINFPCFVGLETSARSVDIFSTPFRTRPLRFVSVGTVINSIKGHDVAVAAMARASELAGRHDFEYRVAGSGVDLESLRRQVHLLGLSDRVSFLGWLDPDQVSDLYQDSDILLHPSRRDAFGVAVLEAMAAGLVVLGSDATAAVCDRIRHGENGFIHRTGDVDELASQIAHLLLHPEAIQGLGCRARRTAEEWPVERGVHIIKSILAEIHATGGTAHSETGAPARSVQDSKPSEADGPGLRGHGGG